MKLPTNVLSHCLAHGTAITPRNLRKNLAADQGLGYSGMVIVPLLIDPRYSPRQIIKSFWETEMTGLVCGLIPGNGPSPFEQPKLVLESLRRSARFAATFAEKGLGLPILVGPLHTHHCQRLPANWSVGRLHKWQDKLESFLKQFGLSALYEPLNEVEDKTPRPFRALFRAVQKRNSGLHYDTGHAHARKINFAGEFRGLAPKIGFLEFANVGRWPLDELRGIIFESYAKAMEVLPDDCTVGVEPFCQKVIKAFELSELCDTTVSGEATLKRDAAYLQKLGIMAKAA